MQLLFVADGPRDEVVLPHLVQKVVQQAMQAKFRSWTSIRLNRGSGYQRKLRYATRLARESGLDGVVAVVDRDRANKGERLAKLREGRELDRAKLAAKQLPVVIGEANPHTEAWLLDDANAVRETLNLDQTVAVPSVRKCKDPKEELHQLITPRASGETELDVLSQIAGALDPQRCQHAKETGLEGFLKDVRAELCQ